jgi:hypothetical protein
LDWGKGEKDESQIDLLPLTNLTFSFGFATKKPGDTHPIFSVGGTGTITPESKNHFKAFHHRDFLMVAYLNWSI